MTSHPKFDLSFRPETYFDGPPAIEGDLPDYLPGEVEIASTFWTTTIHGEVVSVRARPDGNRVRFRVVDESDHRFEGPEDLVTTALPLTLGELIRLIDEVRTEFPGGDGLVECVWSFLHEDCDTEPDELRGYIDVGSSFYPQLSDWYEHRFEIWYAQVTRSPE